MRENSPNLRHIKKWLGRRNSAERILMVSVGVLVSIVGVTLAQRSLGQPLSLENETKTRLIIKYKPSVNKNEVRAKVSSFEGTANIADVSPINLEVISLPESLKNKIKAALAADPRVQYVEEDSIAYAALLPNDPMIGEQWYLGKVGMYNLWDKNFGQNGPVIAVLDTGVFGQHADLQGKMVPGRDFINNDTDPADDHGHGTAVSGVVAANTNNAYGVAGGCPGCRIMPVKVLGANGSGPASAILSGIRHAVDNGATVINMSLSGMSFMQSVQDAIYYAESKGVVVVAAAGNDSSGEIHYPSGFDKVIAVGATDQNDVTASFSNFGWWVDLAAPGTSFRMLGRSANTFVLQQGTSFASPLVASVVGVLKTAFPQATRQQINEALVKTTDPCCSGRSMEAGRMNANRAYDYLANLNPTPPPPPPPPPADTTRPVVSVTAPANGTNSTIGTTITMNANASDNVAVTKVEFYNGTTLLTTDTASPYSYAWNTTGQTAGSKSLTARAYDAAGNNQTSAAVTINLTTPTPADTTAPTVSLTAPAANSSVTVGSTVNMTANAADNVAVTRVEFYNGTTLLGSDATSPYSYAWNTTGQTTGSKSLTAKAFDAAGNTRSSAAVAITLSNPNMSVPGDANGDGKVNALDLSILISRDGQNYPPADFNGDGTVGAADMAILLARWTW